MYMFNFNTHHYLANYTTWACILIGLYKLSEMLQYKLCPKEWSTDRGRIVFVYFVNIRMISSQYLQCYITESMYTVFTDISTHINNMHDSKGGFTEPVVHSNISVDQNIT